METRNIVFTEEVDKIALSANHDKIIPSIDSIRTYAYETSKDLVCKKEEIKFSNIKNYENTIEKIINFDCVKKESTK